MAGSFSNIFWVISDPGYNPMILLTFLLGLIMLTLGIIGEYLRILDEVRRRPPYIIDEVFKQN